MGDLVGVILPVFLVIGFGYGSARTRLIDAASIDALMRFTQTFAIPVLLFAAMARLDLDTEFDPRLLASFYLGAAAGFATGLLGARYIFGRDWEDAVAIGFCGLFSNSILLGLPISERAFGTEALHYNFAIISIHAPFCYGLGVTAMEIIRSRGTAPSSLPRRVLGAMFRNALVIGLTAGLALNLSGLTLSPVIWEGVDLMARAALPTALFALGGILMRYRPEGDLRVIGWICATSLLVHPAIAFGTGTLLGLSTEALRATVVTAAMAPGINTYIFANLYGRARRVAASGVLIGTALSIFSVSFWLAVLP
ncbi:AEC family transporter [Profundibacterium mesophilum]|uniref:Permease n=1 Tax=Profundibacterium mesophilum KAUST100406-0324 TaxID=1037889 RepID=A0A921NT51_9RHOB|nr:AEC family transporter [Profundibacterium mesophilum]KAF0676099.1 Permease [Profundibacterium mesophilum KAUST100406-0324]